jgi:hypothetical protein
MFRCTLIRTGTNTIMQAGKNNGKRERGGFKKITPFFW